MGWEDGRGGGGELIDKENENFGKEAAEQGCQKQTERGRNRDNMWAI